jgi:hypothetical protein
LVREEGQESLSLCLNKIRNCCLCNNELIVTRRMQVIYLLIEIALTWNNLIGEFVYYIRTIANYAEIENQQNRTDNRLHMCILIEMLLKDDITGGNVAEEKEIRHHEYQKPDEELIVGAATIIDLRWQGTHCEYHVDTESDLYRLQF